jgi:putative hemolysin
MPIRVALIVAVLTAGIASSASAGRLKVGESAYLSSNVLACPTLETMKAVLTLADTNFDAAVAKGAAEGCRTLEKGTEVLVVELPKGTLACVTPEGAKACEWTAQARVAAYN